MTLEFGGRGKLGGGGLEEAISKGGRNMALGYHVSHGQTAEVRTELVNHGGLGGTAKSRRKAPVISP